MYSISRINKIEVWCKLSTFVGHRNAKRGVGFTWIGAHMIHTNIKPEFVLTLNMNKVLAIPLFGYYMNGFTFNF